MAVEIHIMGNESLNILRARDISMSGVGVHVQHGFSDSDLENEVELVIALPAGRSFLARGMVRHRHNAAGSNFFGVEFTEMKPQHRRQLRDFIYYLSELDTPSSDQ
jgi:c-di-GMP-binding flagellar brake protein YcgR